MEAKASKQRSVGRKGGRRRRQGAVHLANPNVTSAEARSLDFMPGSTPRRLIGDDEQLSEAVLYEKTTTMEYSFPLKSIVLKEARNKSSADLYWRLPGMNLTSAPADVCHVYWAHISLTNHSDYRIYARVQKPMGFKGDPSSLAMWEPYGEKNTAIRIVEPGASTSYTVKFGSTTFMCPHQIYVGGSEALHLVSLSFTRDAIDKHGNAPVLTDEMKNSLVVVGTVKLMYRSASADVGKEDTIGVRAYDNTEQMDHVDPGPVSDCTLETAFGLKGKILDHFSFKRTSEGKPFLVAVEVSGKENKVFSNLDTETLYRLPTSLIGTVDVSGTTWSNVTADVIKYDSGSARWELGKYLVADAGVFKGQSRFYNVDVNWGYASVWSPFEKITPIKYNVSSGVRVTGVGRPTRTLLSKTGQRGQYRGVAATKFSWLPSYTVILRVVKDLAIYALATGLLENNLGELGKGQRTVAAGSSRGGSAGN